MSSQYKYTDKLKTLVHVTGDNTGTVPRGHRFWSEWGIKQAEEEGNIALFAETTETKLAYPESYQKKGDITEVEVDDETGHYILADQVYVLIDAHELLDIRLEELKVLRDNAMAVGFNWGGVTINADRDVQGDLHRMHDQYINGIKEPEAISDYKVGPLTYIKLIGQQGVLDLLKAMTEFVEMECFAGESLVAQQLAVMDAQQLADADLNEMFQPDKNTDRMTI